MVSLLRCLPLLLLLAGGLLGGASMVLLYGRMRELSDAGQMLNAESYELSQERRKSEDLQMSVSLLSEQLSARSAERDQLASQLEDAKLSVQAAAAANTRLQSQLTDISNQAKASQTQHGNRTGALH